MGRKDDIIIRGGENIAPAEIEAVLHAHPAVDEAAVIGLPDVDWGQKIAAFVALRPGKTASVEELSEFCRQRLASFMCVLVSLLVVPITSDANVTCSTR